MCFEVTVLVPLAEFCLGLHEYDCMWAKGNQKFHSGNTLSPCNQSEVEPPEMHLGWVLGPQCELFYCSDALFWCHTDPV